ncbi:MAG: RsmE family RNA methyltransferase [Desulfobacca sp.]|uniref:RsmE family RNA methyltransferase n=1 Tax=Desulfobacca sp. TaxID=2067990 RepID=UPI00404ACCDF
MVNRSAAPPTLGPRRRVYAGPEQFRGDEVFLTPHETHHLSRVLRLAVGDQVEVADGCGQVFTAAICQLSADGARLRLLQAESARGESHLKITLGLALVRTDTLDLVIRQMTEMGVQRLVPFYAGRSLARPESWHASKLARWHRLAQGALKSCERAYLPDILPPVTFAQVLAGPEALKILCWEDLRRQEPAEGLAHIPPPETVRLLIGPEGGFTDQEVAAAQAAGFQLLGLGPRRLRVETAAMAAVSLLQYLWGDLRA